MSSKVNLTWMVHRPYSPLNHSPLALTQLAIDNKAAMLCMRCVCSVQATLGRVYREVGIARSCNTMPIVYHL